MGGYSAVPGLMTAATLLQGVRMTSCLSMASQSKQLSFGERAIHHGFLASPLIDGELMCH